MKTKVTLLAVPLAWLCLSATGFITDIISKLGMDQSMARNYLLANITGSFNADFDIRESEFFYPRLTSLASIAAGDKAGAAKELCQYVRDYVNSQEFLDAYNKKRLNSQPESEPAPMDPESLEAMRTSIKELETTLADLRKSPKENAQTLSFYEPMVAGQKASLAEYEDPTPNKTKWEKNYPADPAVLVKRRLQEYLDLVATVDFSAQLTAPDKYSIRKFVNPDYEGKSNAWKACYRAGKDVNLATSAFVKDWLAGEIISPNKTKLPIESPQANMESAPADSPGLENDKEKAEDAARTTKEKTSLLGKLKKAKALIKD